MPVSALSRLTCKGLVKEYCTLQGFLPAVLPEEWFDQSLETQTSDDEDYSPCHPYPAPPASRLLPWFRAVLQPSLLECPWTRPRTRLWCSCACWCSRPRQASLYRRRMSRRRVRFPDYFPEPFPEASSLPAASVLTPPAPIPPPLVPAPAPTPPNPVAPAPAPQLLAA